MRDAVQTRARATNPIVGRELRTLLRLRSVTVGLVLIPLLCTGLAVIVALDVLFGEVSFASPSDRGPVLLEVASWTGLMLLSLLGAVLGAQSLGGERQGRTLEPLLLSGLSPARIVEGKTVAVWSALAVVVLGCLTPMGLCFLLGGVSLAELLGSAALLLAMAALPVTFGVYLGAAFRSARLALGVAVVAAAGAAPVVATALAALAAAREAPEGA